MASHDHVAPPGFGVSRDPVKSSITGFYATEIDKQYFMYYVYILENIIDGTWYIGFSTDVDRRLLEHNTKSGGKFTRQKSGQWRLIYLEGYLNKIDALGREKFLKSGSGRRFIKKQIKNYLLS